MSDNIKVVVKVRPLISREIEDKLSYQWRVKNNTLYQLDQNGKDLGQSFTFDKVYDKDTKTSDVYNDIAKPIVEAATAGFNGTIFAYGQTSSGKTFTMTGTDSSSGIIQLAVINLFEIIKNVPDRDFLVRVSYIEIYNETVKDLLNVEKDNIRIHESLQGIKVDATEKVTSSPEEVLEAMKEGEANRQKGATNMNEQSSRSHSIFQIIIESREHIEGEEEAGCVNVSQLNLVDLAGSERSGQTGATGLRFKEGTHINKSLSALALVIKQLSEDPNKYANYRDSKLTRILQNSLGGNAKTSIICAVTPAAVEETISTLQFANRAKAIKNKPEVNAVATDKTMIQRLTKEMCLLKSQLESKKNIEQVNYKLQNKIANLQKLILNGFAQRRSVDLMSTGTRRKLQQPRRITISTLHSIEDEPVVPVPKFCTPSLKYNPNTIAPPAEFAPIQTANKLASVPEEPARLITPPPTRSVNFNDEVIELDSDDDDSTRGDVQTCSPIHKCYGASKTPPCILRRNAKVAEKNLKDIVELTEREKVYAPSVVEFIEKLEHNTAVIATLQDEIEKLRRQSKEKDLEVDHLRSKIKKTEEDMMALTSAKIELLAQCNNYNTRLTDAEVCYETLRNKAKLREEELLSLLEELKAKNKKPEDIGKVLSRTLDKEMHFMDMSKDISLVNSDSESIVNTNDDECEHINDVVTDTQSQIHLKNKTIIDLEANIFEQLQNISSLENLNKDLEEKVTTLNEKLGYMENENSLLKSKMDTLNLTINNQKEHLVTANNDIDSYNSVIQELQIKLTQKDSLPKINIDDSALENMIANEETFMANNDNMKNIVLSLKNAIDARNKEIDQLKITLQNSNDLKINNKTLTEQLESKEIEVNTLNSEVENLKKQINENIATINKLMHEKNNFKIIEQELSEKLASSEDKNSELEKINAENAISIKKIEEENHKLNLTIVDKDVTELKISDINKQLLKTIDDMTDKISDLEKEISLKDDLILSLQRIENESKEYLLDAKAAVLKSQLILGTLSGNMQEVPAVIDNFVNIFSVLSDSMNTIEKVAKSIVTQKEEAVKNNEAITSKHISEVSALTQKINQLNNELHTTRDELDTKISENETLQTDLKQASECIETCNKKIAALSSEKANLDHDLLGRKNIIENLTSRLEEIENILKDKILEIDVIEKRLDGSHQERDELLNSIYRKITDFTQIFNIQDDSEEVSNDCGIHERILGKLEKIGNHITFISLKNVDDDINKVSEIKLEAKKEVLDLTQQNLTLMEKLSEIENKNSEFSSEVKIIQNENNTIHKELLVAQKTLEKLQQELELKCDELTSMENKVRDWKEQFMNLDCTLKQEMDELKIENENLKASNAVLSLKADELTNMEIKVRDWKEQFTNLDCSLKQEMDELKLENENLKASIAVISLKADELTNMENKARDWKEQFTNLDGTLKQEMDELKLENENLKASIAVLKRDPKLQSIVTYEHKDVYDIDTEERGVEERNSNLSPSGEISSPPSLVTICCNKIVNSINPKEIDSKTMTVSSNAEVSVRSDETYIVKCNCSQLSLELKAEKEENARHCIQLSLELKAKKEENAGLIDLLEQMEVVNLHLIQEQEAARREIQLLVAPAQELQKKMINHKTNLAILTATTFAENRSLKSQVKVLQHHHSRFHNVCQRDIPEFKKQLRELMTLLNGDPSIAGQHNSSFKRYSLPSFLDSSTALPNYKNESTLDGDLLMLDTNITVTTTADNTMTGHDQTCLDLTQFYNEASCQTNNLSQINEQNIQEMEILSHNNQSMYDRLNMLNDENNKLRELLDKHTEIKQSMTDTQSSPIKTNNYVNENVNKSINDGITVICDCGNVKKENELQDLQESLNDEIRKLTKELSDIKLQKADIEEKYNNLMLEMPSTDILIKKLTALEKDNNNKIQEIDKLSNTLRSKTLELNRLQDENDTLSTQVMENISEVDDLNEELDKLKKLNSELLDKCSKSEQSIQEQSNQQQSLAISCSECIIKDEIIQTMQKRLTKSHARLNRSLSDSDTSSRFNKICTLQSELHAGREDCKSLTEDVVTIKNHLECSDISMDLDDSMGESNMYTFAKDFVINSPQSNKCNMPDIPEERTSDIYIMDKTDCFNYYAEKTGLEKDNLNQDVKIIELMKMFYEYLFTKHNNEVENLTNKLKDYDESKCHLEIQLSSLIDKHSEVTTELQQKDQNYNTVLQSLSQIKNNVHNLNKEIINVTDIDITRLVNMYKDNFIKVLDNKLGLSSVNIFESLVDNIVTKHQTDLTGIMDRYTKLQEHLESVTKELNSVNENLTQMRGQLSARESEYNLLKAQKERIHEISSAVTLDIVKKDKDLTETVSNVYKKLIELNVLDNQHINLMLPINENVNILFEHLINQYKNNNNSDLEKEKETLALEVKNFQKIIEEKQKEVDLLQSRGKNLQEINNSVTMDLVDKENQLQAQKALHEDLKKIYESKVEENKVNFDLIKELSEEVKLLKCTIRDKEKNIEELDLKIKDQNEYNEKDVKITELLENVKGLQDNIIHLKAMNEVMVKEKDQYALELLKSGETIKQNNIEMDKLTSDILVLKESVRENGIVIENLNVEAKNLLKQNMELKMQLEDKCKECSRLETNMKTHEKTAEIQSRMIMRLEKQKSEDDKTMSEKNIQIEELKLKCAELQKLDDPQTVKELEQLTMTKATLEARVSELESLLEGHKPRLSIDAIGDSSRRRRQSLHDSKRLFAEDKHDFEDHHNNLEAVFESRAKPDDLFMDVDENISNRSSPIRLSKGRDSLSLSKTDQSDKDDEHPSRPSSVEATRRRRQSIHDLHRSVLRHTPSPHGDSLNKLIDDIDEINHSKPNHSGGNDSELSQLRERLASCQQELEDLKEKYRELDEECETCAEYLRERDEQCVRLKKERTALQQTIVELKEKLQNPIISEQNKSKPSITHVAVNTDEDWTNLHAVVVDRMSYDAEVEKNKKLTKTIEELRFKKLDLKNTIGKMQKALERNSSSRELESTRHELHACKQELVELRVRYKELDEECETCAEYLREKEEQCRRLKEAKAALEAKLQEFQDDHNVMTHSTRKKRQSAHDQNRSTDVIVKDAATETSDDLLSYQVERDGSFRPLSEDMQAKEMNRLKLVVEKLSQQKAMLEQQLVNVSASMHAPHPMYVATGSAIVQNQQITDVMKENQKLKKINAKLVNICKKRGKDSNRENEDPANQG